MSGLERGAFDIPFSGLLFGLAGDIAHPKPGGIPAPRPSTWRGRASRTRTRRQRSRRRGPDRRTRRPGSGTSAGSSHGVADVPLQEIPGVVVVGGNHLGLVEDDHDPIGPEDSQAANVPLDIAPSGAPRGTRLRTESTTPVKDDVWILLISPVHIDSQGRVAASRSHRYLLGRDTGGRPHNEFELTGFERGVVFY